MNFSTALSNETHKTFTENGATAMDTTGSALLDLFASIGALRTATETRIHALFAEAYRVDPLLATKCLFYARDIRGGLGERRVFRTLLKYAATYHPEAIRKNIPLIPFYGRYDDWYFLIGTPLEEDMWKQMKNDFFEDLSDMANGLPVSLLAKWMKTADASSKKTRELGILTAQKLNLSVYNYKRMVRKLRKYIDVTEVKMSEQKWNYITYSQVPSKAMMNYRNAFFRHDEEGFTKFLESVRTGNEKINSGTLYPYDILEKYGYYVWGFEDDRDEEDAVLEEQWKALPNYVTPGSSVMVIADTSGSMSGRPLYSAVGLAIYFAERNKGPYNGLWMSFSRDSAVQHLKGETLLQKLTNIDTSHWGSNTNLERAFMHILHIATQNHVPADEMVKSIVVVSDMEIDCCTGEWSFYDEMEKRFRAAGYKIPGVVFWNVNSRHDIFHADADRKGVMLVSGQSPSTFKHVVGAIDKTPVEMMLEVLGDERYSKITLE